MNAVAEDADGSELRLALVLTGGGSLAIWMGGVAYEIQRLASGLGGYGALSGLIRSTPVIDVIGGSSAGGINGAVLALSVAHGTDVGGMRDIWVDRASLPKLLRDPQDPSHASFFLGDGYFLPQLRDALRSLASGARASRHPLELILTGTLMDGTRVEYRDDFGSGFSDTSHRAEFRFRRDPDRGVDDFADPSVIGKLALAARATSSFPGAFEPALCPVSDGSEFDLTGHANFTSTSYVIDGGVLVNKPLRPVLDWIVSEPEGPGTRRVIVYVQPAPDQELVYGTSAVPTFAQVIEAGLLNLPHTESLARDLAEVARHNAQPGAVPIELLHISAEAPNGFDTRSHPAQKLAGLQLQHFGAFYKSAWRANDWTWGRLDGVVRLVQLLLAPRRLHQLAERDREFPSHCYDVIRAVAAGPDGAELAQLWDEAAVRRELAALTAARDALPSSLPTCVLAVARGLQYAVVADELPLLAERIRADAADGHRILPPSRATLDAVSWSDPPTYREVSAALGACTLADERIADDAGSPAHRITVERLAGLGATLMRRHTGHAADSAPTGHRSRRPSVTMIRAVHHAALGSRTLAVVVTALLLAGSALVVLAAWPRSAELAAITVGALLLICGAGISSLLARRSRQMVIVTAVSLAGCFALGSLGPWPWRAWALVTVAADLAASVARGGLSRSTAARQAKE